MGQGLVSQELIRQIKERADITEVVSGYVSLTRAGQNLKGLCPFHAEKTPSFTVSPSRQVFHCFGCGAGGDVVAFLMKRENMGFVESVRELGRRAGVDVTVALDRPSSQEQVKKEGLWRVNESAAVWFRGNLADPRNGKDAQAYLASRGIASATAQEFGVGLALPSWDGLIRALTRDGFGVDVLEAAGLIVARDQAGDRQRETPGSFYDRFRGRVMFPIRDLQRRVIGFGGRVIGEGIPKYLNSPESPVFRKGGLLYGLERAREAAWQTHSLLVVEGYFDAVALYQAGVKNVVATLGTALTPEHVKLIQRFAKSVSLIFDPDPAGIRAVIRTLDLFRDSGIGVRVVSLPEGDDPDTYVRARGADAFRDLESRAPSLVEFAVEQSVRGAVSGAIEDRVRSIDEILRILQTTENRIEKEECLRVVAERLGISQAVLVSRYPELKQKSGPGGGSPGSKKPAVSPERRVVGRPEERALVQLLLQGHLSASQTQALEDEAFTVPALRRIVEAARRHVAADGPVRVHDLLDEVVGDSECGAVATELTLADDHYEDLQAYIRGCLETLQRRQRESRLAELIAALRSAERDGHREEALRLNAQVNELRVEKSLGAASQT